MCPFGEQELPPFTLITGANGSGKTQLLQGVLQGAVHVDGVDKYGDKIKYFDFSSFVQRDGSPISNYTLRKDLDQLAEACRRGNFRSHDHLIQPLNPLYQLLVRSIGEDWAAWWDMNEEQAHEIDKTGALLTYLQSFRKHVSANVQYHVNISGGHNDAHRRILRKVCSATGRPPGVLREEDIRRYGAFGGADLFDSALNELFVSYVGRWRENKIRQSLGEEASVPALSDQEFVELNGRAPWDILDEALGTIGLDFRVASPSREEEDRDFRVELQKAGLHAVLPFSDLSSGEKVLLSLALCYYYSQDFRQLAFKPALVLLDEVDAVLHPAMAKSYLDVIVRTLVTTHGVEVIATTHSASTVALAPEDSIFIMQDGILKKAGKPDALNLLTFEVPTLALSYNGRRQVFVESPDDAEIYSEISTILKGRLRPERSLDFIHAGSGHGGCTVVKSIVKRFVDSGNNSVFGLIDWDGENAAADRVEVLSPGLRYSIESAVFDPLVIALAILSFNDAREAVKIGFLPEHKFVDARSLPISTLEIVSIGVMQRVLGAQAVDLDLATTYLGGVQIKVASQYLHMNGHSLEGRVLDSFPILKRPEPGSNLKPKMRVIRRVLSQYGEFVPVDLFDTLSRLLNAEAHIP